MRGVGCGYIHGEGTMTIDARPRNLTPHRNILSWSPVYAGNFVGDVRGDFCSREEFTRKSLFSVNKTDWKNVQLEREEEILHIFEKIATKITAKHA